MTNSDSNADSNSQTYSTHQQAVKAAQRLFDTDDDVSVMDIKDFDWSQYDVSEAISESDKPHTRNDILAYLYWVEDHNQSAIAQRFGYTQGYISDLMEDVPTGPDPTKHNASVGFYTTNDRPKVASVFDNDTKLVYSYRLLAVAEYGIDALKPEEDGENKVVHHKTGIPLDNRPEAIEVVDKSEHNKLHNSDDTEFKIENKEPRLRNGNADPDDPNAVEEWWGHDWRKYDHWEDEQVGSDSDAVGS